MVWRAVGCLRHQAPAPGIPCVGGVFEQLVGFLVLDYWIVDASITHWPWSFGLGFVCACCL
jgi:hypothetical protein